MPATDMDFITMTTGSATYFSQFVGRAAVRLIAAVKGGLVEIWKMLLRSIQIPCSTPFTTVPFQYHKFLHYILCLKK